MGRLIPNKVITFGSELLCTSRWTSITEGRETGGDLFGAWSNSGCPIVWFATGPGPQAVQERAFFCQDPDFLSDCGNVLIREMGLQHIGQWHSHHTLGLHEPSSHDKDTVARAIKRHALPGFLLVILSADGEKETARAWLYAPNRPERELPFCVLSETSPIREQLSDRSIATIPRGDTVPPPCYDTVPLDAPFYEEATPEDAWTQ